MSGHGHGFGYGLKPPSGGGGGGSGGIPLLDGYVVGIDYSSYVDPGGASSREVVSGPVTNLAPGGSALSPTFTPGNWPILHDDDWVRDNPISTIPKPAADKVPWFSVNKSTKDTRFSLKSEFEVTLDTPPAASQEMTIVMGLYQPSTEGGIWLAPYYCNTERAAMQTSTDRIDVVSNDATRSNLVASGGSVWGTDGWHMVAISTGEDYFVCSVDGTTATYTTSPVGLGGLMTLGVAMWGTVCDGGFTCLHIWNKKYSLIDLGPVLYYVSERHGLPYAQ